MGKNIVLSLRECAQSLDVEHSVQCNFSGGEGGGGGNGTGWGCGRRVTFCGVYFRVVLMKYRECF